MINQRQFDWYNIDTKKDLKIFVYADASYARKSAYGHTGLIVFLVDRWNAAPIFWKSKRQTRVSRGTMKAEMLAVEEAYIHCSKHVPRLVKTSKTIQWGTDDPVAKSDSFFLDTARQPKFLSERSGVRSDTPQS